MERAEELREKNSVGHLGHLGLKGENNPMFGRCGPLNPMFGRKRPDLSEYNRTRINPKPMLGKKQSEETKLKNSISHEKYSEETSIRMKENNPMFDEETREKVSRSLTGRPSPMKGCKNPGASKYMKEHNPRVYATYPIKDTSLELEFEKIINDDGFCLDVDYLKQKRVGNRLVDFYFPKLMLIVETDGWYWHQDKEKEDERDREILEYLEDGWEILHYTDDEVKQLSRGKISFPYSFVS